MNRRLKYRRLGALRKLYQTAGQYGSNTVGDAGQSASIAYAEVDPQFQQRTAQNVNRAVSDYGSWQNSWTPEDSAAASKANLGNTASGFMANLGKQKAALQGASEAFKTGMQGVKDAKFAVEQAKALGTGTDAALKAANPELFAQAGKSGLGQGLKAGVKSLKGTSAGTGLAGAGLGLAGAGVSALANDDDATTLRGGEAVGGMMQGAGIAMGMAATLGSLAPALAVPGLGWAAAGVGGLLALRKGLKERKQARLEKGNMEKQDSAQLKETVASNRAAELQSKTYSGFDYGRNLTAQKGGPVGGGVFSQPTKGLFGYERGPVSIQDPHPGTASNPDPINFNVIRPDLMEMYQAGGTMDEYDIEPGQYEPEIYQRGGARPLPPGGRVPVKPGDGEKGKEGEAKDKEKEAKEKQYAQDKAGIIEKDRRNKLEEEKKGKATYTPAVQATSNKGTAKGKSASGGGWKAASKSAHAKLRKQDTAEYYDTTSWAKKGGPMKWLDEYSLMAATTQKSSSTPPPKPPPPKDPPKGKGKGKKRGGRLHYRIGGAYKLY